MISIGGENLIDLVSGDPAANGLPQYVANPALHNVAMAAGTKLFHLTDFRSALIER